MTHQLLADVVRTTSPTRTVPSPTACIPNEAHVRHVRPHACTHQVLTLLIEMRLHEMHTMPQVSALSLIATWLMQ